MKKKLTQYFKKFVNKISQLSTVNHQPKGLTIIEAMLTLLIIGGGLIGVMYAFVGGSVSSLIADQSIVASNLAKEKLEEIISDRANNGYPTTITTSYSDNPGGDFSIFTRTVTFLEVDPDDDGGTDDFLDPQPGSGYARVTVVVSWPSSSVKLESLIANYTMP